MFHVTFATKILLRRSNTFRLPLFFFFLNILFEDMIYFLVLPGIIRLVMLNVTKQSVIFSAYANVFIYSSYL